MKIMAGTLNPDNAQKDPKETVRVKLQFAEINEERSQFYKRWEYLENVRQCLEASV